jgi:hypothetical protein
VLCFWFELLLVWYLVLLDFYRDVVEGDLDDEVLEEDLVDDLVDDDECHEVDELGIKIKF